MSMLVSPGRGQVVEPNYQRAKPVFTSAHNIYRVKPSGTRLLGGFRRISSAFTCLNALFTRANLPTYVCREVFNV
jgi:hypothetical protein